MLVEHVIMRGCRFFTCEETWFVFCLLRKGWFVRNPRPLCVDDEVAVMCTGWGKQVLAPPAKKGGGSEIPTPQFLVVDTYERDYTATFVQPPSYIRGRPGKCILAICFIYALWPCVCMCFALTISASWALLVPWVGIFKRAGFHLPEFSLDGVEPDYRKFRWCLGAIYLCLADFWGLH